MDKLQIPQQHSHASFLQHDRQEPRMQNCYLFLHHINHMIGVMNEYYITVLVICPHVNEKIFYVPIYQHK